MKATNDFTESFTQMAEEHAEMRLLLKQTTYEFTRIMNCIEDAKNKGLMQIPRQTYFEAKQALAKAVKYVR